MKEFPEPIVLKTRITNEKLVIEFSSEDIRAIVVDYNQCTHEENQREPGENFPLYRIANLKVFAEHVFREVIRGSEDTDVEPGLAHFLVRRVNAILMEAGQKPDAGIVELPSTAHDAEGMGDMAERRHRHRPAD